MGGINICQDFYFLTPRFYTSAFYFGYVICVSMLKMGGDSKGVNSYKNTFFHSNSTHKHQMIIHTYSKLHTDVRNVKQDYLVCFVCSVEFVYEHKYTVFTVCLHN